jgi:DNA-binding MarR family transcriptional regulator
MVQAIELSGLDVGVAALYRAARSAQVLATGDPLEFAASRILGAVGRRGPVRPSAVAHESHVDLSTASRHIDTLVRQGLVAKSADPDDARASLVEVTAQGRAVLDVLLANRSAAIAPALADWPDRDRSQLVSLLVRLADDLDDLILKEDG